MSAGEQLVPGHVIFELQRVLDASLDHDHHGAALAMLMATWLAPLPPDAWLPMMSLQTQTVVAWANAAQARKRKRKPKGEAT